MNFYEQLPVFTEFEHFTNTDHFKPIPRDWILFITDVKGSTSAIKEGRYKEVNTVGAASIVVARKAMKRQDFPFIFGGDGATLLVPETFGQAVAIELCALKRLAKENFSLDLRIGMVSMSELYDASLEIHVAKYEMTRGRSIAVLRGDGLGQAEEWIKNKGQRYHANETKNIVTDLTGLSCRWQPFPSKNGKILNLIILSRRGAKAYEEILNQLKKIFPAGFDSLNPATSPNQTYKSIWQCLKDEHKYHSTIFTLAYLKRFLEIIPAVIIFKYKLPIPFLRRYATSMASHSDFRKFDNALRMVLDCKLEQIQKVKVLLANLHREGTVYYGTFESDNSLMTCFVEGLNQGEHIHFMDGENGGYAMAAIELKKQMKQELNSPS